MGTKRKHVEQIIMRAPEDLRPADYNPREISEKEFADLCASIQLGGFLEPVLVNSNPKRRDVIIGGHQRQKAAIALGLEEIPTVEVSLTLPREREMNVRMNKNRGRFDFDILANMFETTDLLSWGFDETDIGLSTDWDSQGEAEDPYTNKIKAPVYEPRSQQPPALVDMVDESKCQHLLEDIEQALNKGEISEDVGEFLWAAAQRHLKFDYGQIAEYYAHAPAEVQRLMEKSALVVIDFQQAIEEGYVRMTEQLRLLSEEESG